MDARGHTHEELQLLVSLHALDALEPDEAAAVAAHLTDCDACRTAFDEALETAAMLALTAPGAEPPAGLRERILTSARATPQDAVQVAAPVTTAGPAVAAPAAPAPVPDRPRRRFREVFTPSRNFAAAFAIAAGLLGVLYLSERSTNDQLRSERAASALVGQVLAAP